MIKRDEWLALARRLDREMTYSAGRAARAEDAVAPLRAPLGGMDA